MTAQSKHRPDARIMQTACSSELRYKGLTVRNPGYIVSEDQMYAQLEWMLIEREEISAQYEKSLLMS